MNTYLCGHGNCHEVDCPVIVTDKTTEPHSITRYCTRAHAIAALLRKIEIDGRNGSAARESAQLAMEGIVRLKTEAA